MSIVQPVQNSGSGWISFGGKRMMQQPKPFKTVEQQLRLLESRGLSLDPHEAERWLRMVGYYRLSGYWYPYRKPNPPDRLKRTDEFVDGSSLEQIVSLYEFDRKLRTLVHDGVERAEVALRAQLSGLLGEHGPLEYTNEGLFRPSFAHGEWIETAKHRARRAKRHSVPINHHVINYGGKFPIWVLVEVLDFSDVSKLYGGLRFQEQAMIAEQLGIHLELNVLNSNQKKKAIRSHPLSRCFEQLTILRNTSAHHGRVWNQTFIPVGTVALRQVETLSCLPERQSERIFGALTLIAHFLKQTSPGSTWASKVRNLVDEAHGVQQFDVEKEMGFTENWKQSPLWIFP